ncbi:hypothetical protein DER29_6162 [Micromonospora sp. M71_S20]|uniref:hypothetical protein n=1 Tax=Micromonospora sp. M71_S20 TaxID=592872 RepID=UPI000F2D1766|nr:hypothetical protein [Micromonospora sp. M71_S20]RLK09621.1 hypothetical protein DER29_6162 [Micromonospora sp. M71_S20]
MGILGALGSGLVAGIVGTAAMTVTQRVEMAVSRRAASSVPGQVGAHLIPGRNPAIGSDVQSLNAGMHWSHGIAMGSVRGLLQVAGLTGPAATAAHCALLWMGDVMLYKSLGVADWPWRWTGQELATDLAHKGVYAAVTGLTYDKIARNTR